MVVLPAPVWPTMAAVSSGSMVKETPRRIHSMSARCGQFGLSVRCGDAVVRWSARRVALVGEPDVAELDAAGVVAWDRVMAGRDDVGFGVEELEDALAAAMAACRMLYLSLRSWMGRKKRCAYWMKAMRTPRVTTLTGQWQRVEQGWSACSCAA